MTWIPCQVQPCVSGITKFTEISSPCFYVSFIFLIAQEGILFFSKPVCNFFLWAEGSNSKSHFPKTSDVFHRTLICPGGGCFDDSDTTHSWVTVVASPNMLLQNGSWGFAVTSKDQPLLRLRITWHCLHIFLSRQNYHRNIISVQNEGCFTVLALFVLLYKMLVNNLINRQKVINCTEGQK